ncbi:MAG: TetR/AcrR family transcriptional regulator [Halioglobus sp.]
MREITKSSATHERILLSAVHCYGLYGVEETSLEQVASQAGVGRTTVYRHAKNKRELLNKVLLRDAEHALGELEVATRYYESLDAVVVESILFLMRRRNGYEMQHILYGTETDTTQGNGLSLDLLGQLAAQALQEHFEKACAAKAIPPGLTLPMLADWVGRITLSLHSQPSAFTATEENLRAYLNVVLRPIFNY